MAMETIFLQWRELAMFLEEMFIFMNPSCKVSSISGPLSTTHGNGMTCLHAGSCRPCIAFVPLSKLDILHNCSQVGESFEGMRCVKFLYFLHAHFDDVKYVSMRPYMCNFFVKPFMYM